MSKSEDEEMVRINVEVPKSVRNTAKDKLEFGGISREVRDRLQEIAFGADLNQRSRLERRRDDLNEELRSLRAERRELDAEIENTEQQINAVDEKLSNLSTREDKYEAKLEELEGMVRQDGMRVFLDHPAVKRAAQTGGVEPEGVIEALKERNPDVPSYAFQDGIRDSHQWSGVSDDDLGKAVEERERRYR